MKFIVVILACLLAQSTFSVDFNKAVKPILSKKCFSCHGRDKQKGKLRLDTHGDAIKKNVIKPGVPQQSLLIERIFSSDPEEIMPPSEHDSLTEHEKNILKEWIKSGAAYEEHWSFQQILPPKIPDIKNPWIKNPIDAFIFSSLKKKNMVPKPEADKSTLSKRLSFVLNGIPPDKALKDKFTNGQMPYKELYKEMLNKSSFGEKMALFWLDGARYADTNGIEHDSSRPIWPYRDWVINAFNTDMPYNQFIIEQLAGDLLPNASISQIVATGFNRCHMTTNEVGSIEEEFLVRYAKDRLNTASTVFLGLTIECAECHDHKYDPISHKEYYQMLAFFNNIEEVAVGQPYDRGNAPLIPIVNQDKQKSLDELNEKIQTLDEKMAQTKKKSKLDFITWHYDQILQPPKTPFLIGQLDAYFPFDENEGSYTFNLVTEHMCNIKGTISRSKGVSNKALSFRGTTMVDCLNICKYERTDQFSAGMWIKMEQRARGAPLAKFDTAMKKGWKFMINNGELFFELLHNLTNGIKIKYELEDKHFNDWIHIAVTYNGNNKASGCTLYINGQKVNAEVVMDNLNGSILTGGNLRIGAESSDSSLTASEIDDVFAAKKVLKIEDIKLIAKFNAASRFALVSPSNLSEGAKHALYEYYLKNHNKTYKPIHEMKMKLSSQKDSIFNSSVISMVMKERDSMKKTFVLGRGSYQNKGEEVKRSVPDFLRNEKLNNYNSRHDLAKWVASENNPLTSRVIVNRIWIELFGKSLLKTPGDFGIQGAYPDHPELLDYLAFYLVQKEWSIKKLVSHIVESNTFKQASTRSKTEVLSDPKNLFYSSYPRHRLKAEFIRDQVLKISSKINDKIGGEPVFPPQPEGLWNSIASLSSDTRFYTPSDGENKYRKSIYTFWKRSLPPPAMSIFNAPNRQDCVLIRNYSNTPLQALVTLNDPQFTGLYKLYADKFEKLGLNTEEKVYKLFDELFHREPNNKEMEICIKFLKGNKKHLLLLVHSLMNTDEFFTVE